MNKELNLNDKEITETPKVISNNFISSKLRQEIEFLVNEKSGRLWPYHRGKKALSASTLTKILREIEYEEIPEYILRAAKLRGTKFHDIIQEFVQNGNHPSFVDLIEIDKLSNLEKRVHETINFLKKKNPLKPSKFVGSEKLHYVFYKDELLATYVDLEFHDYIIELKTSNIKANESPLALLIFEIQLLIQYLCTRKRNVCLLWSTGQGIIFDEFQKTPSSLKLLDVLIELEKNGDTYSSQMKKAIIQKILDSYSSAPKKLIC